MKNGTKASALAVTLAMALTACQSPTDPLTGRPQVSNTAAGAGLGALTGAVAGLLIAKDKSGDDQQELRAQLQSTGVQVARQGDQIILIMPSNVTFATDQDQLSPSFYPTLDSVAIILGKYPRTLLDIDGHTDDQGSDQYNQALSERRAVSVAQYLGSRGIDTRRFRVVGYGESAPIADNGPDFARQQNRRVEVRISPIT